MYIRYIEYCMLTKKNMITLKANTIYHQSVTDAINITKQLFKLSITAEVEKKTWNTFEAIIKQQKFR